MKGRSEQLVDLDTDSRAADSSQAAFKHGNRMGGSREPELNDVSNRLPQ